MSSSEQQPLSALAASLMDADATPEAREEVYHNHADHGCGHGWWAFIFYFLVIALVLYFVFFALRPSFVLKNDCDSRSLSDDHYEELDNGKLLGSAIVGALILIFIFWLFAYAFSSW